jgi:hypothetical protein
MLEDVVAAFGNMFPDVAVSSSARPTEAEKQLNINQSILPSNTKANHFIIYP